MAGQRPRYRRESSGVEFDRVAFFSDAVFAIAMTLLVVGIGIPTVAHSDLAEALREKQAEIVSFFVSFVVIGNYWLAHHRFVSRLAAVTPRLMTINLVYLAAIAFTPFPTALAGKYTDDPISIVMYAITLGVASGLEGAMFLDAHREGLFRHPLSQPVLRYAMRGTMVPVLVFFASIPIAVASHTTAALLSWLAIFPIELVLDKRFKPRGADEELR